MRAATTAWTRAPLRGGCAEIRTSEYTHISNWPRFKLTRALCLHTRHRDDGCSGKTCSDTQPPACSANPGRRAQEECAPIPQQVAFLRAQAAACVKHRFVLFPKRCLNSGPRWLIGSTDKIRCGFFFVWVVFFFFFYVAPAQSAPNCLNVHQSPSMPSATRNRPAAPCARLMKETEEQSGSSQGGAEAAAPDGALSPFIPPVSGAGGTNEIRRCFTLKATGRI